MKRFNMLFAVCLTLSVLGGTLLPFPATCDGFSEPLPIEVQAEGETSTTDTGIGVLITMLLANGIRFVGNFNDSVKPGIEKLWDDFTTATGNTITLATLGAQSVVQLGYLRTSSAVNNAVSAFQQWYTDTFSVPSSGSVDIPISSGESSYYQLPSDNEQFTPFGTVHVNRYSGDDIIRVIAFYSAEEITSSTRFYFTYCSPSAFTIQTCSPGCRLDHAQNNQQYLGSYYGFYTAEWNIDLNTLIIPYVKWDTSWGGSGFPNAYMLTKAVDLCFGDGVIADTSMTGQTLELKDGFNISNDQAKLIDLAGIESLVGTLGLTLENVNDLIDSIPLIMDYPWAESFPDDPTFADTPVDAIPWVDAPTAVVPAEVPEYVPETPADEESYKVLGLERVFPFSIPFDFIAVVNLLNAEPVCPEFTFRVYNPISRQNIDATMSFERFEAVAQVIRIAETIGFIVFLILITRSLIRS